MMMMIRRVAAGDEELVERRASRLSAVDPVGNYLLKRRIGQLPLDQLTDDDKRLSPDPVGSYLLRRRRVDPVGSYLLKKSLDD